LAVCRDCPARGEDRCSRTAKKCSDPDKRGNHRTRSGPIRQITGPCSAKAAICSRSAIPSAAWRPVATRKDRGRPMALRPHLSVGLPFRGELSSAEEGGRPRGCRLGKMRGMHKLGRQGNPRSKICGCQSAHSEESPRSLRPELSGRLFYSRVADTIMESCETIKLLPFVPRSPVRDGATPTRSDPACRIRNPLCKWASLPNPLREDRS